MVSPNSFYDTILAGDRRIDRRRATRRENYEMFNAFLDDAARQGRDLDPSEVEQFRYSLSGGRNYLERGLPKSEVLSALSRRNNERALNTRVNEETVRMQELEKQVDFASALVMDNADADDRRLRSIFEEQLGPDLGKRLFGRVSGSLDDLRLEGGLRDFQSILKSGLVDVAGSEAQLRALTKSYSSYAQDMAVQEFRRRAAARAAAAASANEKQFLAAITSEGGQEALQANPALLNQLAASYGVSPDRVAALQPRLLLAQNVGDIVQSGEAAKVVENMLTQPGVARSLRDNPDLLAAATQGLAEADKARIGMQAMLSMAADETAEADERFQGVMTLLNGPLGPTLAASPTQLAARLDAMGITGPERDEILSHASAIREVDAQITFDPLAEGTHLRLAIEQGAPEEELLAAHNTDLMSRGERPVATLPGWIKAAAPMTRDAIEAAQYSEVEQRAASAAANAVAGLEGQHESFKADIKEIYARDATADDAKPVDQVVVRAANNIDTDGYLVTAGQRDKVDAAIAEVREMAENGEELTPEQAAAFIINRAGLKRKDEYAAEAMRRIRIQEHGTTARPNEDASRFVADTIAVAHRGLAPQIEALKRLEGEEFTQARAALLNAIDRNIQTELANFDRGRQYLSRHSDIATARANLAAGLEALRKTVQQVQPTPRPQVSMPQFTGPQSSSGMFAVGAGQASPQDLYNRIYQTALSRLGGSPAAVAQAREAALLTVAKSLGLVPRNAPSLPPDVRAQLLRALQSTQ